jgi:hypothetical protein
MTHQNCSLSGIQSQDDGWGFVVRGEGGTPLVALTYETKAEAEDARNLMAKVIMLAGITPLAQ